MAIEHTGPGGVSTSYGIRNTSGKSFYSNQETYQDVFIPTGDQLFTEFLQEGVGAIPRTPQDKASETISVKDFGAVGDGVADDTLAIQKAIDAGKPYSTSTSGRRITFPSGRYKVSSSIDLTGCHGVQLIGDGPYSTEIFSTGDFPVISAIGSSSAPLNKARISGMTIRGFGSASTSAHGIEIQWGNHCYLDNLVLFGCRHAVSLHHQWQTSLLNISVHGAGGDQSYIGVYLGPTDLTYIDNAVQACNVFVQSVSGYGFRIINGQGSKFVNCEAGGSPMIHAWYIGDPSSGSVKCQWLHFSNCLGDSTTSAAWLFRQGTASEIGQMQLSSCWAGNGDHGFYFDGVTNITGASLLAVGNTNSGIRFVNSSHNTIIGSQLKANNESASSSVGDIHIQGGSYNTFIGNESNSNAAGKSLLETSGTDSNTIIGNVLLQGATIIGAGDILSRNRGLKTENRGSAQITSGTTSVVVNHGLNVTPTADNVRITPRDNMGSASKAWVTGAGATSFTINVNVDPGATITFGWSVDI